MTKKTTEKDKATNKVASNVPSNKKYSLEHSAPRVLFRLRRFQDPSELQELWNEYEESKSNYTKEVVNKDGTITRVKCHAPVSIQDFCCEAGIMVETFNDYCNLERHREFRDTCKIIKQKIHAMTMNGALSRDLDGNFAKLVVKNNHGMVENKEDSSKSKGIGDIKIVICNTNEDVKRLEKAEHNLKGEIIEAEIIEEES